MYINTLIWIGWHVFDYIVCLFDIFYGIGHIHFSLSTSCWRPSTFFIHESFYLRCTWVGRPRSTHAEHSIPNFVSVIHVVHAWFVLTRSTDISISLSSSDDRSSLVSRIPSLSSCRCVSISGNVCITSGGVRTVRSNCWMMSVWRRSISSSRTMNELMNFTT